MRKAAIAFALLSLATPVGGDALDSIDKRLGSIEGDMKQLTTDVGRINTVGTIFLLLFTVIVGPVVVYRVQKQRDQIRRGQ